MSSSTLTTGIIFASQTGVGILGNIFLLFFYIFIPHTGQRLKDVDLILNNLMFANSLALLSRGIPRTMLSFGMKNFLGEIGCKLVFYLHRVGRGVSLGATCILSCFQAIKISPGSTQWIKVKATRVQFIRFSMAFCWTLHMLVNSIVLNYISGPKESKNHTQIRDLGYCSGIIIDKCTSILYLLLFSFIDLISLACMVFASGFMMFILYKHKQNVLYIHRKNFSSKFSAENRATQSILMLVITFACFYFLSSFFTFYTAHSDKHSFLLVDASSLLAASFPCLSPFVIISRDPRVCTLCLTSCAKVNNFCKWKTGQRTKNVRMRASGD